MQKERPWKQYYIKIWSNSRAFPTFSKQLKKVHFEEFPALMGSSWPPVIFNRFFSVAYLYGGEELKVKTCFECLIYIYVSHMTANVSICRENTSIMHIEICRFLSFARQNVAKFFLYTFNNVNYYVFVYYQYCTNRFLLVIKIYVITKLRLDISIFVYQNDVNFGTRINYIRYYNE